MTFALTDGNGENRDLSNSGSPDSHVTMGTFRRHSAGVPFSCHAISLPMRYHPAFLGLCRHHIWSNRLDRRNKAHHDLDPGEAE